VALVSFHISVLSFICQSFPFLQCYPAGTCHSMLGKILPPSSSVPVQRLVMVSTGICSVVLFQNEDMQSCVAIQLKPPVSKVCTRNLLQGLLFV